MQVLIVYLLAIPLFVGVVICLLSGSAAGIFVSAWLLDKITDRLVRQFNLYDAVIVTAGQRIQARRKKRAEKNS